MKAAALCSLAPSPSLSYCCVIIYTPCVCANLLQLCPALWDRMDSSPPGSSAHGDSTGKNTRVGCHFSPPGYLPDPEIEPVSFASPASAGGSFTTSAALQILFYVTPVTLASLLPWTHQAHTSLRTWCFSSLLCFPSEIRMTHSLMHITNLFQMHLLQWSSPRIFSLVLFTWHFIYNIHICVGSHKCIFVFYFSFPTRQGLFLSFYLYLFFF